MKSSDTVKLETSCFKVRPEISFYRIRNVRITDDEILGFLQLNWRGKVLNCQDRGKFSQEKNAEFVQFSKDKYPDDVKSSSKEEEEEEERRKLEISRSKIKTNADTSSQSYIDLNYEQFLIVIYVQFTCSLRATARRSTKRTSNLQQRSNTSR